MTRLSICGGCGVHVTADAPCPFCRAPRSGRSTRAGLLMAGLLALGGAGCGANPPQDDPPAAEAPRPDEPPPESTPDAEAPPPEPVPQPLYGVAPIVDQPLYGLAPVPATQPDGAEEEAAREKAAREKAAAKREAEARQRKNEPYAEPPLEPLYGIAPLDE